jgi:hypothetical protein
VRPVQSKWGLSAWVDRCGRTVTPSAVITQHAANKSSSR